jgi:hypothetical protein
MRAEDRTAIYLAGIGLGSNALALSLPQLWPHFPWWVYYSILCTGIALIVISLSLLIHEHILNIYLSSRGRKSVFLAVSLLIVGGGVAYYLTKPSDQPLSLLELYITDFPDYYCLRTNLDETDTTNGHLKMVAAKCRNYDVNSYLYTVFIPDVPLALPFCATLPNQFQRIADQLSNPTLKLRVPGDSSSTPDADLIFTGRVYIYTESDFSPAEIGNLYKLYRNKNLFVQFRGFEYRTAHWKDYDRRENNVLRQFKKENSVMFR